MIKFLKYLLINNITKILFFTFIILLFYTIYKSEFVWLGKNRSYYISYYFLSLIILLITILSFILKKEFKIYLVILFSSILTSLYMFEIYYTLDWQSSKIKTKSYYEKTGKEYGPDFPIVTVKDWVNSQKMLADYLEIDYWACVVGGSLGGMQALQWAISYPKKIKNSIIVAAAAKLSAQNIAFNEVARQAIITDPDFHDGRYNDFGVIPKRGLSIARMLGHITYLSDDSMRQKFGRDLREGKLHFGYDVDFQVESYLRYQAQAFVERFDANTYLLMTKALDYFDPANEYEGDLSLAFEKTDARFLVVSFTSDWRFSSSKSHEIVKSLVKAKKNVSYAEIEANQGHDAFLMPIPDYLNVLSNFMDNLEGLENYG